MSPKLQVIDKFYPDHHVLRGFFEQQFANPHSLQPKRFVWDYWHVPQQYSLLRTPAYHYFTPALYMKFHRHLVQWGRENLGCWDISPPWLSCYIHGSHQEMHTDRTHGLWAFVYSLSPNRGFKGGETFLLNSQSPTLFSHRQLKTSHESRDFFTKVKPLPNRLIVFDPQTPHGVTPLCGSMDPAEGRLVLHGWFTEPKTYKVGPLPKARVEKVLNQCFDLLQDELSTLPQVQGVLALRLRVNSTGQVTGLDVRSNTLKSLEPRLTFQVLKILRNVYQTASFGRARGLTEITLPLVFS